MTTSSRSSTTFTDMQKKDALRLAKGLFESKVLVNRPPSTVQRATYNTSRPRSVPKSSRTKQVKPDRLEHQLVNPAWQPFSHDKSLSHGSRGLAGRGKERKNKSKTITSMANDQSLVKESRLPKGVHSLESWINEEDDLERWIGVPSDPNCFVILPRGFHPDVECLPPPPRTPDEPLLERPVEEIKKYIPPKILHNFNYLESTDSFQCQHDKKRSDLVEARESTKRLRTSEIIKQEIEELERLLQGYGNPNSSSIVNRYQYEITSLKQMVVETLRDYTFEVDIPEELESTIIHGDLFQFLERHEEIIAAIKEKRDACVKELARLEQELQQDH